MVVRAVLRDGVVTPAVPSRGAGRRRPARRDGRDAARAASGCRPTSSSASRRSRADWDGLARETRSVLDELREALRLTAAWQWQARRQAHMRHARRPARRSMVRDRRRLVLRRPACCSSASSPPRRPAPRSSTGSSPPSTASRSRCYELKKYAARNIRGRQVEPRSTRAQLLETLITEQDHREGSQRQGHRRRATRTSTATSTASRSATT